MTSELLRARLDWIEGELAALDALRHGQPGDWKSVDYTAALLRIGAEWRTRGGVWTKHAGQPHHRLEACGIACHSLSLHTALETWAQLARRHQATAAE